MNGSELVYQSAKWEIEAVKLQFFDDVVEQLKKLEAVLSILSCVAFFCCWMVKAVQW